MGLKLASSMAILALFALIYAVVFVISIWFLPASLFGLLLMLGFTVLIVLFQYAISPLIIRLIYRIDWINHDEFVREYPHLGRVLDKVVSIQGIKVPKMGIIDDLNPNAFTFGYTRNSARIVLTGGILHFLDEREQEAVLAHELGHVIHNDFILMTVVFAIPLMLLTIARWSYYAARFSGVSRGSKDNEAGYLGLALIVVAVISYISYYIGYLISLLVSRIREYYADEHSAEVTENPNTLSTALVKIAYGLLISVSEVEAKQRRKSSVRALRGLGIFDPGKANQIAVQGIGGSGQYDKRAVEAAAGWDLFNPWAKYFQLFSTHPLPAKRIQRLNQQCAQYGTQVEIDFSHAREIKEDQVGKSMIGEFLTDIIIKHLPTAFFLIFVGFSIIWLFGFFNILPIGTIATISNLIFMWFLGFYLMGFSVIARTKFMYRSGFDPKNIVDLVSTINVSPVRPVPAIIEGAIIGKGIPGYYFSDDLFFQDNTGLLFIDYRFGLSIVDFFWAITKVNRLIGQKVRIQGWYRRGPSPYLQIDTLWTEGGKRYRNYAKHMTYILAVIFFIIGALLLYLWIFPLI
jgi:Zn-dependent protease with chaperone function